MCSKIGEHAETIARLRDMNDNLESKIGSVRLRDQVQMETIDRWESGAETATESMVMLAESKQHALC